MPYCELMYIREEKHVVKPLVHTVDILGTNEKEKYFTVTIAGNYEYTVICIVSLISVPLLATRK